MAMDLADGHPEGSTPHVRSVVTNFTYWRSSRTHAAPSLRKHMRLYGSTRRSPSITTLTLAR